MLPNSEIEARVHFGCSNLILLARLLTLTSTIGSCSKLWLINVLIIPLLIKITGRGGNESELSQGSGARELKNLDTFVWPMFDLRKNWSCMPHGFSALFRLELTQVLVSNEVRFCDVVINTRSGWLLPYGPDQWVPRACVTTNQSQDK